MALVLGSFYLASCGGGTKTAPPVEAAQRTGFLTNYDRLEPGPEGGAQLRYRNPEADFKRYTAVMLDPVQVWKSPQLEGLSAEDRQRLADHLYVLIRTRLAEDFRIVDKPTIEAFRMTIALTGAEASRPVLDTISSIIPQARIISGIKSIRSGKPAFVGESSAEVRVTDSTTGTVLVEAVDRRVGRKGLASVTNSWNDVDQAFTYWAERIGYTLCVERGGSECVAP